MVKEVNLLTINVTMNVRGFDFIIKLPKEDIQEDEQVLLVLAISGHIKEASFIKDSGLKGVNIND